MAKQIDNESDIKVALLQFEGRTVASIDWLGDTEDGIVSFEFTDGSRFTVAGNDLGAWLLNVKVKRS